MILVANQLLNSGELQQVRNLFDATAAQDGKLTAGGQIATVKRNREYDLGERAEELKTLISEACNRAPHIGNALLPRTISRPILSDYEPGMAYGRHTDSAIGVGGSRSYRTDVSCTIFLDDPATYQGGELAVETEYGNSSFKLPAGDAVFYPTLFTHQVLPVTSGRRRACVFWLESFVRDPQKRAILLDMVQLSSWMGQQLPVEAEPRQRLTKVRENLYRMWLDT